LQAELRAKQEEDEREKQAAVAEMKKLTDKIFLEGYARQASLAELKAREDRIAHQIALLKQSESRFEQASPSNAAASSPAAAANDVADVPRCVEAIKMLQAKHHGGANEVVLVSRLGLAINPKIDGLKSFLLAHPQHFVVSIDDGPTPSSKATVASVKLK